MNLVHCIKSGREGTNTEMSTVDSKIMEEVTRAFNQHSIDVEEQQKANEDEEKNWQEVIEANKVKAAAGDMAAQSYLGRRYFLGWHGLAADEAKAFPYFLSAADQGDAKSQQTVGLFYEEAIGGVKKDNQLALRYYQLAADQGAVEAQYCVGKFYLTGLGGKVDLGKAVTSLTLAAAQDHARAQCTLAECFRLGHGVEVDLVKSVDLLQRAAAQQYPLALELMGLSYLGGTGVERNQDTALQFLAAAAQLSGSGDAFYSAGIMHLHGRDLLGKPYPVDNQRAVSFFERAAALHHVKALYSLAVCYEEGCAVSVDTAKVTEYLQRAVTRITSSDPQVLLALGNRYLHGRGVPQDQKKAVQLLERAVDAGLAAALPVVGMCYHSGVGVAEDKEKGLRILEKAALMGFADPLCQIAQQHLQKDSLGDRILAVEHFQRAALFSHTTSVQALLEIKTLSRDPLNIAAYGLSYVTGLTVRRNNDIALRHLKRAADLGFVAGLMVAGSAYQTGEDALGRAVAVDGTAQTACYEAAAAYGDPIAQYAAATCFMPEVGVTVDDEKALKYLQLAAAQDCADALLALGNFYAEGRGVPENAETAFQYFQRAANKGNVDAVVVLAGCYADGYGVAADTKTAIEWYRLAAEHGHPGAEEELLKLEKSGGGV